ncbi:MAG: hypothetical protein HY039_04330 [Nitrospirae bacterium]|nr:hypothetical protein [Nitrospirota bacterium]
MLSSQRGGSIIAAVFLIIVIGFLGAIVVSLVSTQSFQSVGELKSTEALYIADGGIEYALKTGTNYNYSYPVWSSRAGATVANPCPSASAIALGNGNFCVDPPTVLTATIVAGAVTIPVVSTTGFPASGILTIDSEQIAYTGTTPTSFTGLVTTAGHNQDAAVYPATTLTVDPGAAGTTISVASTPGFLIPGIIKIDSEYIHCTGTTAATFTGCLGVSLEQGGAEGWSRKKTRRSSGISSRDCSVRACRWWKCGFSAAAPAGTLYPRAIWTFA